MLAILWRTLPTLGRTPSYGTVRSIRDYHAPRYNWPAPKRPDEDETPPVAVVEQVVPLAPVIPRRVGVAAPRKMTGRRMRPLVTPALRPALYPALLPALQEFSMPFAVMTNDGDPTLAMALALIAVDDF